MIRQARLTDFEAIDQIEKQLTIDIEKLNNSDYVSDMQRNGFLVKNVFTKEHFAKEIENIFLVTEIDNKIVGHLRIESTTHMDNERPAIVFKPQLEETFVQKPFCYLDRLSLLPEYRNKKLASKMLEAAINLLKKEGIGYLYSFVVVSPITNTASIIFHDYNGFERVDIAKPMDFAGFTLYQSFKYCKILNRE